MQRRAEREPAAKRTAGEREAGRSIEGRKRQRTSHDRGHRPVESADQSMDAIRIARSRTRTARRPKTSSSTTAVLENVFVYVKDGLNGYGFDVPTEPVKLDQHGCRYHAARARHSGRTEARDFQQRRHAAQRSRDGEAPTANGTRGRALKNMVDEKVFTKPEVMVQFKCDVHNWMHAYVGVLDHPYFAVTHDGGKFELKDLPAGTYTVEAWHEKLGTQTQTVTLGEKESKELTFTFKAPRAGSN